MVIPPTTYFNTPLTACFDAVIVFESTCNNNKVNKKKKNTKNKIKFKKEMEDEKNNNEDFKGKDVVKGRAIKKILKN